MGKSQYVYDKDQGPVPERCNNSISGINVPYSSTFIPGIELLDLSGTGPSTTSA